MTEFVLDPSDAKRVALIANAAGTGSDRPILKHMLLEWDAESLRATATDSYLLATRRVKPSNGLSLRGQAGQVTVEAKPFAKALGRASVLPVVVEVGDNGRTPTVTVDPCDGERTVVSGMTAEGWVGNWRQVVMFDAKWLDRRYGRLPLLNPEILVRAIRTVGKDKPLRFNCLADMPGAEWLKPVRFTTPSEPAEDFSVWQMPIRP